MNEELLKDTVNVVTNQNWLSSIISKLSWLNDVAPLLLLLVTLIFLFIHLNDFARTVWIFIRLLFKKNKNDILDYFSFLLKADKKLAKEIMSFNMLFNNLDTQLNSIIRENTFVNAENEKYGIYDKVETRYYVDFQKACIKNCQNLEKLALILSLNVIQNCDLYRKGEINHLCAQAFGNIILAHKVSEILGIPLLIVGTLEGKQNTIFGDFNPKDRVIVLDDISSSGGMIRNTLKILLENDLDFENIYTLLKRSTKCDIEVAKFSDSVQKEIKIISYKTLLDNELADIIKYNSR